jgi:hypothetical protein
MASNHERPAKDAPDVITDNRDAGSRHRCVPALFPLEGDAAINASGDLEALPYWSAMIGFTHRWSDQFRSTVSYGYVNLEPASGQAATFYRSSQYASANLVWQMRRRLSVGLECLYGTKEVQDGTTSGDHWRAQVGMVYSLFD